MHSKEFFNEEIVKESAFYTLGLFLLVHQKKEEPPERTSNPFWPHSE